MDYVLQTQGLTKRYRRGKALDGGTQKNGIATFIANGETFVKGENAVEIVAPEAMTLHDFAVSVKFQPEG